MSRRIYGCCLFVRVWRTGNPLSGKKEFTTSPELSRQPHEDNQSYQYDHEAFLGKEEATTFDQLTPEEAKPD